MNINGETLNGNHVVSVCKRRDLQSEITCITNLPKKVVAYSFLRKGNLFNTLGIYTANADRLPQKRTSKSTELFGRL